MEKIVINKKELDKVIEEHEKACRANEYEAFFDLLGKSFIGFGLNTITTQYAVEKVLSACKWMEKQDKLTIYLMLRLLGIEISE